MERGQLEQAVAMRGSHRYSPRYAGLVAKTGTRCSRQGSPSVVASGSPRTRLLFAIVLASRSRVEETGTRTGGVKGEDCPALVPLALVVAKGSSAGYCEQEAGEQQRLRARRMAAKMGRRRLPACSGCQ